MKQTYKHEVLAALKCDGKKNSGILEEADIKHLPLVVQKYLHYVGVVGKNKVYNARITLGGTIRSNANDPWMKLTSEQYNFFENPTRIFYIKACKMGIPAVGIHLYKDATATMKIKLAGMFTIVDAKGIEMNQAETVTVFNDMCIMAPSTLIDKNIRWESLDALTVKATYTNGMQTISAVLYFNEKGELINFMSNDRYDTSDGKIYKNYPWVTPIKEYKDFNGYRLASSASLIYLRPDGDFCYGEFLLTGIAYNCKLLL